MTITTVVFDAYGTLFDVAAAARQAADEPACAAIRDSWREIAETWRRKQLEYTWLRAVTGYHTDFWRVTRDALDWTLEAAGHEDPVLRDRLLALYRDLAAYPEVPAVLADLKSRGLQTGILSNGSQDMLAAAIASAGIGDKLDAVLSVDSVGVFKPDAAVYDLVQSGLQAMPRNVLFVSSNGWDVASAAAYGFRTLWVNRAAAPVDRIPGRPDAQSRDLAALPSLLDTVFADSAAESGPPLQYFQTSDGLKLAYSDAGSGPVILCLAGLTRNMADFDFVARDFADRARIVRMDYRGRGASDYDPEYHNYNLIREGRDALELLDHLGIDKAAILGTSRGGLIAMMLAQSHRERLSGVCLNDIGPVINAEGIAFIFSYLGVVPEAKTYEEAADALVRSTARQFPGVPRSRWRLHAERIWRETGDGLALRYDANLRRAVMEQSATGQVEDLWPFFDRLAGLPVALIHGENSDIIASDTVDEMKRRHPGLIVAEVPRRGHVPFLDERESHRALSAFIDALESAPAAVAD